MRNGARPRAPRAPQCHPGRVAEMAGLAAGAALLVLGAAALAWLELVPDGW